MNVEHPGAGVTGVCQSCDMYSMSWNQGLWKSSKHSQTMRHPSDPKFIYFWCIMTVCITRDVLNLPQFSCLCFPEWWIRGYIIILESPIDFNGQRRRDIKEWRKIVIAWCKEIFWVGLSALGVCCFSCCCHEYLLGTRSLTDFRDWILSLNSLTYNGNCASAMSQSAHVGLGLMLIYDGGGLWP